MRLQERKRAALAAIAALLMIGSAGCGAVHHAATFEPGFASAPGVRVEIGSVTNATSRSYDVDVVRMLTDQLTTALQSEDLLWAGGASGQQLVTDARIIEYEEGNAFQRWLLPGWGTTILSVECDVKRKNDGRKVGSVEARRTIAFGGAYTIGAWRTIFRSVSSDIAEELKSKLRQ